MHTLESGYEASVVHVGYDLQQHPCKLRISNENAARHARSKIAAPQGIIWTPAVTTANEATSQVYDNLINLRASINIPMNVL